MNNNIYSFVGTDQQWTTNLSTRWYRERKKYPA